MAKKQGITYEEIVRQVRAGDFKPIYYLMGEEPYYIDRLADFIVDNALKEEEKDFNLTVLYCSQTDGGEVVNAAKANIIPFDADGIVDVPQTVVKPGHDSVYDLSGRRTERARKGIYIVNRQKVVVN
jgi:hypothetical protein